MCNVGLAYIGAPWAWLVAIVVLGLPAFLFLLFHVLDRVGILPKALPVPYRCPSCEYDIRGAPHDRCPECGREIEDEIRRMLYPSRE